MQYMEDLVEQYPNISRLQTLGKTYEGRDIGIISISLDNKPKDKVIFIQGGLHARYFTAALINIFYYLTIHYFLENGYLPQQLYTLQNGF